jgi:GT2 family glycosyltransferase
MTFSVLICTYNRHKLLERALRSLVVGTQEKPDQIVVVNGGDERADRIVEAFIHDPTAMSQASGKIEIRLVKVVNRNLAASRNVGLQRCTGEIIAMTDDDAEVFPDWVTLMKRAHQEHPDAGAVGGPVLGTNTESIVGKVADAITFPSWPTARCVRTLPGVNVSYKRQVVDRLGPQDETLFRGEDVDYNWRLQQLGYKVYFDPGIKVYHYHRATLGGFLHQHYMYGRAYYLVRHKWPEMHCVYPHSIERCKDVLKAANFAVALLYQPFLSSQQISSLKARVAAIPILMLAGLSWKGGMLIQAYREFRSNKAASCSVKSERAS